MENLDIVDESVNTKIRILLEYWDFRGKNIDDAWCLREWITWDLFEFEKASCVFRHLFPDPCDVACLILLAIIINLCPYYACYAQSEVTSPMDSTDDFLTLPDSSFALTQCAGLEAGDPFGFFTRFDAVEACFESEETLEEVYDLVETPLESRDVFVYKNFPSLHCNNVLSNPLDHSHTSPLCLLPSHSLEYYIDIPINNPKICDSNADLGHAGKMFNMLSGNVDNFFSLGYFCGYDASFDPYCMYLVDKPKKSCGTLSLLSILIFLLGLLS